jgi:hypothetical protein
MAQSFPNTAVIGQTHDILRYTAATTWALVNIPPWASTITIMPEVAAYVGFETTNGDGGAVHANDQYVTVAVSGALELSVAMKEGQPNLTEIFIAGTGAGVVGVICERAKR